MNNIQLLLFTFFLFAFVSCKSEPTTEATVEEDTTPIEVPSEEEPTASTDYEAIAFSDATPTVEGQEIEYSTSTTKMLGYMAIDPEIEGKRPGVLVIHEWWGHNDYARKRADMLAELGYVALAVDMYGDGKKANHPNDAQKFSTAVVQNMDEAKARFEQALKVLKANPLVDGDKIAAIGYCFGGSVALSMANAGYDLDAVAAFHAGVELPIMPSPDTKVTANILVANGAADPFISPESVVQWTKAMDKANAAYEYMALEDVKHAYTDPDATKKGKSFSLPLEYNQEADATTWAKTQELLASSFR